MELRKLRCCKEKCDVEPLIQNVKEIERIQAKYDIMMNFMIVTLGAIVCSRATRHEKGKKNNKYFLNLENSNKNKSCVRKIFTRDETLTINPKPIFWREFTRIYAKLRLNDEESERKLSSLLDPG